MSFPQHMRNAQSAIEALADECKKYEFGLAWESIVISFNIQDAVFSVLVVNEDGDTYETHGGTLDEAAHELLHAIAGAEEAPF